MSVPILPEHIWSKVSPEAAATRSGTGRRCVGSGPFKVVENKQNSYMRLVANKDYWGGEPRIDELFFETYENADTMVQDLKAGRSTRPWRARRSSRGSAGRHHRQRRHVWSAQVSFNCYDSPDSKGNPVLLDQRFRQALQ